MPIQHDLEIKVISEDEFYTIAYNYDSTFTSF